MTAPLSEAALAAALEREGLSLKPGELPAVLATALYLRGAAHLIREVSAPEAPSPEAAP